MEGSYDRERQRERAREREREILKIADLNTLPGRVVRSDSESSLIFYKFHWFGDSIPNEFRCPPFLERESKHIAASTGSDRKARRNHLMLTDTRPQY